MAKQRGVYEHPLGSGIWWILYYIDGQRHREKVGRWSHARDLYFTRKLDARAGRKLPELRPSKVLTLADLFASAVDFAKKHNRSHRDIVSKAAVAADLGSSRSTRSPRSFWSSGSTAAQS